MGLMLQAQPTVGTILEDALRQGSELAERLNLDLVRIEWMGRVFTCFQGGRQVDTSGMEYAWGIPVGE